MSQTPDELELIVLTLIQSRIARGEQLFMFSAGNLRGKLVSAECIDCLPSSTYLPAGTAFGQGKIEPCVQFWYIPRPRSHDKVKDPLKFNFTRKPINFNVPTRLVNSAVFLQKIEDGMWMINMNTAIKE